MTRVRQDSASYETTNLSREALAEQKQCLGAAPRMGRRPGAVLFAPWSGLRE